MKEIHFEWNGNKNTIDKCKHGISFEEARTVFCTEEALLKDDPDHSDNEDRFLISGFSTTLNMLVVSHCYISNDEVIRIISAGKATKKESFQYYRQIQNR